WASGPVQCNLSNLKLPKRKMELETDQIATTQQKDQSMSPTFKSNCQKKGSSNKHKTIHMSPKIVFRKKEKRIKNWVLKQSLNKVKLFSLIFRHNVPNLLKTNYQISLSTNSPSLNISNKLIN
ncbi:hypothetical protein PanWU01x14_081490, partial [Parasponia andersonii]